MLDEEGVDALMSGLRDRLVGNEPAESLPEYVPKGAAIVEAAQVLLATTAATVTAALAAAAATSTAAATFATALTAALTAATPGRALGASR